MAVTVTLAVADGEEWDNPDACFITTVALIALTRIITERTLVPARRSSRPGDEGGTP
ncbi:hypothetical protein [Rathayibacter toxicus]|uniref:hypothetical protein n=1 Tax=Rathayibacter toxicus TaxID=145458 RepID=UPI000A5A8F40|nr:hypothetical protein [Rathayibacter toxicus]QOD08185.1 hypothetical protein AYW78_10135 [Rathayibacter toxicus]QOD10283.1 hypothetical protein BSG36_10305 [Rathayibacter toxicus]